MSGTLTEPVRIFELAATGFAVDETLGIPELPRLAAVLAPECAENGTAQVVLTVSQAAESIAVKGRVETQLALQCQRCLRPMEYPIEHDFAWMLSESGAQVATPASDFEPILLGDCRAEGIARGEGRDTTLKFAPLIEDELMLQVPFAPMHEDAACKATTGSFLAASTDRESAHPFAALAALKKKRD